MNNEQLEKKYRTYIKSAQGSAGMIIILSVVYVVRALIAGNTNFWFSMYIVQFVFRSNDIFSDAVQIIIIAAFLAFFSLLVIFSQKSAKWLYVLLGVYALDTAFLVAGTLTSALGPFDESQWIDIIVHAFMLVFIVSGIVGAKQLKKMDLEYGAI